MVGPLWADEEQSSCPPYISELLHVYTPSCILRSSSDTPMLKIEQYKRKTHSFRTLPCFGPHNWIHSHKTLDTVQPKLKTILTVTPPQLPLREPGDVWCLSPVWNLGDVIWFPFAISSFMLFFCRVHLLFLSCHFSANRPFSWLFSKKTRYGLGFFVWLLLSS